MLSGMNIIHWITGKHQTQEEECVLGGKVTFQQQQKCHLAQQSAIWLKLFE